MIYSFFIPIEDFLQPVKKLTISKIPRPTQAGWTKYEKRDLRSSETPSKIPKLKGMSLDVPAQNNPEGELLDPLKGEHNKAKEKLSEFMSMTTSASTFASVTTPMPNQTPISTISRSQRKVDKSVPIVVLSPPDLTDIMSASPNPEKSRTKRRHGTDDKVHDVPDERPKQKRFRKRIPDH